MDEQMKHIQDLCVIVCDKRREVSNEEIDKATRELYSLVKNKKNTYEYDVALIGMHALYTRTGNFEKAKKFIVEGYAIIDSHNYERLSILFYSNMAIYYTYLNDNYSAIECYLKSIDYCRKYKDSFGLINNLNNIGDLLLIDHDYKGALKYFKDALKVKRVDDIDVSGDVIVYVNIAKCKVNLGDIEGAEEALMNASKLFEKCTYRVLELSLYGVQLEIDYAKGNNDFFVSNVDKLVTLLEENKDQLLAIDTVIDTLGMIIEICDQKTCDYLIDIIKNFIESSTTCMYLGPYMRYRVQYAIRFDEAHLLEAYHDFYNATLIMEEATKSISVSVINNKIEYYEANKKHNKLIEENKKLNVSSTMDEMTNVLNKTSFYKALNSDLKTCVKNQMNLGIVFFDVDYFKEYNDTYGHLAGDDVLKAIAEDLRSCVSSGVNIGRFGGDEFILSCVGRDDSEIECYLTNVFNKLASRKIPHVNNKANSYVTLSVGYVNIVPQVGNKRSDYLKLADEALYEAKTKRNCFVGYPKKV